MAGHDDTFWLGSWLLSHEPPEALPPSCSLQLIRVQLECRQPASPERSTYLATSELPSSTSIQFPNARFGWFKTRVFAGFGGKFGQFVWCLGVLRMKTLQRPPSVAHQWIEGIKTYQSLCNQDTWGIRTLGLGSKVMQRSGVTGGPSRTSFELGL